ncbi:integrase [Nonomuraea phyllanthi]|uniref:Integrase n=1 Tax=Nonomuraea phyllanthi TaxID=2219224 RepID=A0A5C4URL0_9ACTN|nr:integrase [Nonomuraea phyllanthi]KAB8181308.1 integrase [Nonomuraea phyllanthi]
MGQRQRDCVDCGGPVGIIGRLHCCRCLRRLNEAAAKASCPDCGKQRVLQADTGRCITCSRVCTECGHPVRSPEATLCRDCSRKARQRAAQQPCPRCGRPGYLRPSTGWCGTCSRPRQTKDPPRVCDDCGQLRPHAGHGLCSACWQRRPERPFVAGENLIARLADPPPWLGELIGHLAAGHSPARACVLIGQLGRLLDDEHPNHPQALLERARLPGRSMGPLARGLEIFFVERGLALATDHAERLAAGRRRRRIDAVPEPLRPAAEAFNTFLLRSRERARRAGTLPRADVTLDIKLSTLRDLAQHVSGRGKQDWALVDVHDIEAFLAAQPKNRPRRLQIARQFFRFAKTHKMILIDPTGGLSAKAAKGFIGKTLTLDQQRRLFRRWITDPAVHPHEALLGILALLHGASSSEIRHLRLDDIDPGNRAIRLGQRPHLVPLDPASWSTVQRCMAHRENQHTGNPHLIVTKGTKAGRSPASVAYVSHVLDPAGISPRMLRSTRLIDLVNTMDAKLVTAAFGMHPEGVMIYLADHVDEERLPIGERPPT